MKVSFRLRNFLKTLPRSKKILVAIILLGGVLAICTLLAAGTTVFVVAGVVPGMTTRSATPGSSRAGTPGPRPSLTPLPGQVLSMTRDARDSGTSFAPVHMITETPAPIQLLTVEAESTLHTAATITAYACRPEYPDVCVSPLYHPSCDELGVLNFRVPGADPYGYDRDHNGIGCEKKIMP